MVIIKVDVLILIFKLATGTPPCIYSAISVPSLFSYNTVAWIDSRSFFIFLLIAEVKTLPGEQNKIQSTLVISKSKGPSKTVRDIRTSTYQICSTEEKDNINNQILHMTM